MTARDRTLQAFTTRLDKTQEAERLRRAIEQPTLYDGAGRIRALGAAGAVPARLVNSTGGLSRGQPIQAGQGIISGLPDAVSQEGFQSSMQQIERLISEVRNRRGIQVFQGDPNDSANAGENPAFQEFDFQALYDELNRLLYYWKASDGVNPGAWEKLRVSEELSGYLPSPAQGQAYPIRPRAFHDSILASIYIEVEGVGSPVVTTNGSNIASIGATEVVQLNYSIGDLISVGDRVTLTPTTTSGNPLEFAIGFYS